MVTYEEHSRRAILAAIRTEPGLTPDQLSGMMGESAHQVSGHIRWLQTAGVVRVFRMKNRAYLVASEAVPEHPSLLMEFSRTILAYLHLNPRSTAADMARHLGIPLQTVKAHTPYLQGDGLIVRQEGDGDELLSVAPTRSFQDRHEGPSES